MSSIFLKWWGNKKYLIPHIKYYLPSELKHRNYYEPFCGSGAIARELATFEENKPHSINISDVNSHLIQYLNCLKNHPNELVSQIDLAAQNYAKSEDKEAFYYNLREEFNTRLEGSNSVNLYILNRLGFNGLYRVNKKGKYNVPWGKKKKLLTIDLDKAIAMSEVLQNINITCNTYDMVTPEMGSFVYLDPPYYKTHTDYSNCYKPRIFEEALLKYCRKISRDGVKFLLSNVNDPYIVNLFQEFNIVGIPTSNLMAPQTKKDQSSIELLIMNY